MSASVDLAITGTAFVLIASGAVLERLMVDFHIHDDDFAMSWSMLGIQSVELAAVIMMAQFHDVLATLTQITAVLTMMAARFCVSQRGHRDRMRRLERLMDELR